MKKEHLNEDKKKHHEELKKRTKWNHFFFKIEPLLVLLFVAIVLYILLKDSSHLGYKKYKFELNSNDRICFSVISNWKDIDYDSLKNILTYSNDRYIVLLGDFSENEFYEFFKKIESLEKESEKTFTFLLVPGKFELSKGYKEYEKYFGKNNFVFEIYFKNINKNLILLGLDNVNGFFQDPSGINLFGKKIVFTYLPIFDKNEKCIMCNLLELNKEEIVLWINTDEENKKKLIDSKINYLTLNSKKTNEFIELCVENNAIFVNYKDFYGKSLWFKRLIW
ncbi:MAG: hypothetical protein QXR30_00575 [Candidatus Woesearchaeota archaeon]